MRRRASLSEAPESLTIRFGRRQALLSRAATRLIVKRRRPRPFCAPVTRPCTAAFAGSYDEKARRATAKPLEVYGASRHRPITTESPAPRPAVDVARNSRSPSSGGPCPNAESPAAADDRSEFLFTAGPQWKTKSTVSTERE